MEQAHVSPEGTRHAVWLVVDFIVIRRQGQPENSCLLGLGSSAVGQKEKGSLRLESSQCSDIHTGVFLFITALK